MADAPVSVMLTAPEWVAIIAASLGAAVSLAVLLGIFYKRGLLPNLRADLQPFLDEMRDGRAAVTETQEAVQEIVRQLTVNGHSSKENTVKDDVSEVKVAVEGLGENLTDVQQRLNRLEVLHIESRTELVQHLRWSGEIVPQLQAAIDRKADREGTD